MPPSLPAGWTVTKRSNHSGAYQQLDAIGVTLGFPPRGAAALEFSVNGAAYSLALSIDSGTVTGLDLSIQAEGPSLANSRWDAPLSLLLSGGVLGQVASFVWEDRRAQTFHGETKSWRGGPPPPKTRHR